MYEKTEMLRKIKKILITDWDPIGVQSFPEARDEYDSYAPDILSILEAERSVEDIYSYLLWAEVENMGLSADTQKARAVALKLAALRE